MLHYVKRIFSCYYNLSVLTDISDEEVYHIDSQLNYFQKHFKIGLEVDFIAIKIFC